MGGGGGGGPRSDTHYVIRDNQFVVFKVLFCDEALEFTIFGKLTFPPHALSTITQVVISCDFCRT